MVRKTWRVIVLSAALGLSFTGCMRRDANSMANSCQKTNDLEMSAESNLNTVGKSQLYGSLYNQSLNNDYKNPQIQLDFYDESGSSISSEILVVDRKIDAGEAEKFNLDFTAPVGTERVEWDIVCAVSD